jgi:hypothetical protein
VPTRFRANAGRRCGRAAHMTRSRSAVFCPPSGAARRSPTTSLLPSFRSWVGDPAAVRGENRQLRRRLPRAHGAGLPRDSRSLSSNCCQADAGRAAAASRDRAGHEAETRDPEPGEAMALALLVQGNNLRASWRTGACGPSEAAALRVVSRNRPRASAVRLIAEHREDHYSGFWLDRAPATGKTPGARQVLTRSALAIPRATIEAVAAKGAGPKFRGRRSARPSRDGGG